VWIVSYLGSLPRSRGGLPGDREAILGAVGQCDSEVLEADLLGDEEECLLRDHFLAVHPTTLQPETLSFLLRHFVTGPSSPGA
jgi:hypothetical protein